MNTYKPLPKSLAIKESPIHGYGLFAIEDISSGVDLGVSHVYAEGFHTNYIRTPLGGFINHSDTPNCRKIMTYWNGRGVVRPDYYNLQTLKDIKSGEELTLTYTIYGIDDATS